MPFKGRFFYLKHYIFCNEKPQSAQLKKSAVLAANI